MWLGARRMIASTAARGKKPASATGMKSSSEKPISVAATVSSIVDLASGKKPLKDALKFYESTTGRAMIWTYSATKKHTDAIASGLLELGYAKGDRIVAWLPWGSPEFVALALASARIGCVLVPVTPPVEKTNADMKEVVAALDVTSPRGFVFWHEYALSMTDDSVWRAEENGFNPLAEKLFPDIREDASGLKGITRLTGVPFSAARYPKLKHVVHTGSRNYRQLLCYKNLMVYNPTPGALKAAEEKTSASDLFLEDADGKVSLTQADIIAESKKVFESIKNEHMGLVVPTSSSPQGVLVGLLAALGKETLCVFPGFASDATSTQKIAITEAAHVMGASL
ncbi:hypothetical protein FVE85_7182 [Porphyridium purpureum]|uniref:AMP-dependent synthetase/ligase domain-containing protein n=1 Tax=Porphyridium purpureum TaxID=35688 RepID=A0A5J4ZAD9_PORPP|nr:hypothetical protein FVE85_7182 [Porphyridium purpureum]|eukprot:POR3031..scf295_1